MDGQLLRGFRASWTNLEQRLRSAVTTSIGDPIVFQRIQDDLNELEHLFESVSQSVFSSGGAQVDFDGQHRNVFPTPEAQQLTTNLLIARSELEAGIAASIEASHHGRPAIIRLERTGGRGRPRILIDTDFLHMAYPLRGIAGTARYLGVGYSTVRQALLDAGIVEPGPNPFPLPSGPSEPPRPSPPGDIDYTQLHGPSPLAGIDALLAEPSLPSLHSTITTENPLHIGHRLADISDNQLDECIRRLRERFPTSGVRMMDGMLRRIGIPVPYKRIRESLVRVDPVRRVFQRIKIKRRRYNVPGPNSLWHNDGQHGQ